MLRRENEKLNINYIMKLSLGLLRIEPFLISLNKFGKIFESDYILIESKKLVDVRDYVNSEVIFQSHEDFCLIGFNTMDKNIHWNAKMLNENTGYTCGAAGNILKTTNGGLNWVMLM